MRCPPIDTGGRKRQPATEAEGRTPMSPSPTRTFTASPAGRAGAADHENESRKHAVDLEAERPQPGDPPDADPEVRTEICQGGGRNPGREITTKEASDGGYEEDAILRYEYSQPWRPPPRWMHPKAERPQPGEPPDAHPDIEAEVCRGRGEDPGEESMTEKVSNEGRTEDAEEGTDRPQGWRPGDPTGMASEEYAGTCAEMGGVYRADAALKTFPHSHLLHHQENACIFAY